MRKKRLETDVLIIGGGLAGVWCAYELSKSGKKVILVEEKNIGSGVTSLTTAFITYALDTDLPGLVYLYGPEKARQIWQSGMWAIKKIQETIISEKIKCDFMLCPAYIYASTAEQFQQLNEEKKVVDELGFNMELENLPPHVRFDNYGYAILDNQAKYDAKKFIQSLAHSARKLGAMLFENIKITSIDGTSPVVARGSKGLEIHADDVVVATYDPFTHPLKTMAKKAFYTSYVMQLIVDKGLVKEAIYWDKSNPYFYFRVDSLSDKKDIITLGGADHKRMVPMSSKKSYEVLEDHFCKLFPEIKDYKIYKKWSGPILEPSDGIALIGQYKPHYYMASAFSGNGMTYSVISGSIIGDLIMGKKNEWAEIYDPKRPRSIKRYVKKGKDYVEEFIKGALKNTFKK